MIGNKIIIVSIPRVLSAKRRVWSRCVGLSFQCPVGQRLVWRMKWNGIVLSQSIDRYIGVSKSKKSGVIRLVSDMLRIGRSSSLFKCYIMPDSKSLNGYDSSTRCPYHVVERNHHDRVEHCILNCYVWSVHSIFAYSWGHTSSVNALLRVTRRVNRRCSLKDPLR